MLESGSDCDGTCYVDAASVKIAGLAVRFVGFVIHGRWPVSTAVPGQEQSCAIHRISQHTSSRRPRISSPSLPDGGSASEYDAVNDLQYCSSASDLQCSECPSDDVLLPTLSLSGDGLGSPSCSLLERDESNVTNAVPKNALGSRTARRSRDSGRTDRSLHSTPPACGTSGR